jgi:hypothetical protein
MRLVLSLLSLVTAGSVAAQDLPRAASGRPDLQGIWQVVERAGYDLEAHAARHDMKAGLSVVDGGEIPYQPWAAAQKAENFANRATADPLASCYLPGVPRVMALNYPFQIFQTDDQVAITFEWQQVYRLIYVSDEPSPYAGVESWMGHSRGRWDGDVFVVDVTDQNDRTWLDSAGNFHSAAMQVTAPVPDDGVAFDADAGIDLPLPAVGEDVRRLADGTPDISGWYMADGGGANYGLEAHPGHELLPPSRGHVVDPADGTLPYRTWARAERIDREMPYRGYDDPTAHCFVAGLPRSHYVPAPFFVVQTPTHVVFLHERMAWRLIRLDGEFLPDTIRLWQGDSIGRWEGDSLVVESRNFNGKTWLNETGDVISHMETLVETYTPVSSTQVHYRATVTDPIPYTQPWTMEMPFNHMDDELLEVACLEDNNDLQHLKDVRDEHRASQNQGD